MISTSLLFFYFSNYHLQVTYSIVLLSFGHQSVNHKNLVKIRPYKRSIPLLSFARIKMMITWTNRFGSTVMNLYFIANNDNLFAWIAASHPSSYEKHEWTVTETLLLSTVDADRLFTLTNPEPVMNRRVTFTQWLNGEFQYLTSLSCILSFHHRMTITTYGESIMILGI